MDDLFEWEPPPGRPGGGASLFVFPLARRADFVRRHAEAIATKSMADGDRYLRPILTRQATVLRAKGFNEAVVLQQVSQLSAAIRELAGRLAAGEVAAR